MNEYRLAVIGGDGIGPEVTTCAVDTLEAAAHRFGFKMDFTHYDLGSGRYLSTGEVLPDSVQSELAAHDAILLGAVGTPEVPPGVLERGLLLKLRFDFDLYVNFRPVKLYPGVPSAIAGLTPQNCDLEVMRENTEGLYSGSGGFLHKGTPHEIANQNSVNTRRGTERIIRYAFDRAMTRDRRLTMCHKTNVLNYAGDLWQRTTDEVARDYPDVEVDYVHADAACIHLVQTPQRFDVMVTDNIFGDILTDLGAAIAGGIGLAASGNLNPTGEYPSLFEPVHGSAPDIVGTGWANPVAAVFTSAMLLDYLGEKVAAAKVEEAAAGVLPGLGAMAGPEMGASTSEIGRWIVEAVGVV